MGAQCKCLFSDKVFNFLATVTKALPVFYALDIQKNRIGPFISILLYMQVYVEEYLD